MMLTDIYGVFLNYLIWFMTTIPVSQVPVQIKTRKLMQP